MEIKDFRIGNVLQDRNGDLCKIEEISTEEGIKAFSGMVTAKPLSPVKLTKDLLLKIGFDNELNVISLNYSNRYSLNYFRLSKFDDVFCWDTGYDNLQITYLHQLQNIYFFVKNDEIDVSDLLK